MADFFGPGFSTSTADTQSALALASLSVPDWDPGNANDSFGQPTEWDQLAIGDNVLPGVVTVEASKGSKIDRKVSPGTDGANASHLGMEVAPITVHVRMWTRQQLQDMRRILPSLMARTGKARPDPVTVYHPALAMIGVRALYLENVSAPKVSGPGGSVEMVFRFIEHLPPTKPIGPAVITWKSSQDLSNVKTANSRKPAAAPKPSATEAHP